MDELLTATDIDVWAATQHARAHLPSLVRAAVMATVAPDSIRFPAAEGVDEPGFDGVIEVVGGAAPYVPAGRSVWEAGTGGDDASKVARKASADYRKRTKDLPESERAHTTFVFVTARRWPGKSDWVARRASRGDWAAVRAYDAEDLALWLETLPGVRARFSELLGRQPYGVTPLSRWVLDWCEQTDPVLPLELLIAGRRPHARRMTTALLEPAAQLLVAAPSREEGIAYLAASLLCGSLADAGQQRLLTTTHELPDLGPDVVVDPPSADEPDAADGSGGRDETAAPREALAERTLVVHDVAGWRRAVSYDSPLVLVPLFDDPNVSAATRAGHRVVVARRARAGDDALPPLDRVEAKAAAERHGIGYRHADELARDARRSLTALRRRISRGGAVRGAAWADGAAAALLAPLLLAGAWRDDYDGDRDALTTLADGRSWRTLVRELGGLRSTEDAPLTEREHRWQFVDVIDAWTGLADAVTSDDLDAFHVLAEQVLTEADPAASLPEQERRMRSLSPDGLPSRRHSGLLRQGVADTAALLGAMLGHRPLGGGRTGQQHADQLVYRLLHDADANRWLTLAPQLPSLAEAAPSVFLDALEQSLQQDPAPMLALFAERTDLVGSTSSGHSHLLWALEALAYSPQHLSRVALALARLAQLDPGGRLANRPSASLHDALHLAMPQSAVTTATRIAILDRVRAAFPSVGWTLLQDLVRSLDHGMMLRTGPRRRDWPVPQQTTIDVAAVVAVLNDLAERLADDAGTDPARWAEISDRIDRFPPTGRRLLLDTLTDRWEQLPEAGTADVAKRLAERLAQHEKHPQARWALPAEELAPLRAFTDAHAAPADPAEELRSLFSFRPRHRGRDLFRDREELARRQREAVAAMAADRLDPLLSLAGEVSQPWLLGATLATLTGEHDQALLDLLGGPDPAGHQLAAGLVAHRHLTDPSWLAGQLGSRPDQAVQLLLTVDLDASVHSLLADLDDPVRQDYWRRIGPYRVRDDVLEPAVTALLQHDRPYTALVLLSHAADTEARPFAMELTVRAMRAPMSGTTETLEVIDSAAYVIGMLLNRLAAAKLDTARLAELEWFYLPLLDDERPPRALYQRLATEPQFFADMVALVYRPDSDLDTAAVTSAERAGETGAGARDAQQVQLGTVAWELLHEWHVPLPGAHQADEVPSPAALASWVYQARAALAARQRTTVASAVLGQALSGPVRDPDGTWPSLPVRELLEREQDTTLERHLTIGVFNQRGVTMRSPYSGGQLERDLVARYQGWADQLRDTWPRAGVVLDELARTYLADAQREDAAAAHTSDR